MEYKNISISTKPILLWVLPVFLMFGACSNESPISSETTKIAEISQIDGQAVLKLNNDEFYETTLFGKIRDRVAAKYGTTIINQLKDEHRKATANGLPANQTILLKDVISHSKAKGAGIESSHVRWIGPDGGKEEFVLGFRQYVHDSAKRKSSENRPSSDDDTWLALSPDRFYLQDDENGNEIWPIAFPAVSMEDSSKEITVTFDENGFVSSSLNGAPNIVFVEAVPVVEPLDMEPCEPDCDGGGGGGGTIRTDDHSRGQNPRSLTSTGTHTYFVSKSIMLSTPGDGDGACELQMFVQRSDGYEIVNMPRQYRYRFDVVVRNDPTTGDPYPTANRKIYGADNYIYKVPDVNEAGRTYYTNTRYRMGPGGFVSENVSFFPLIDLSDHAGPWRLVMSDDDKDYPDFSRRRQSEFHPEIDTYNMQTGNFEMVETGFTVERKTYGSSDDPRWASGVRNITIGNVQARLSNGTVTAQTVTEGNTFRQTFDLETYSL